MCVIYLFMQFNRSLLFFLIHLELKRLFFFCLAETSDFWKCSTSAVCINFNAFI